MYCLSGKSEEMGGMAMDLDQIERRLRAVEATQEIINLHNEYLFHLNQKQWRAILNLCGISDPVEQSQ